MKKKILITICCFFILQINSYKTLAQSLDNNSDLLYRPKIHFSPEAHWMNDPNGMVYYKGVYHLFFQYYPDSNVWGPMHWGHATSNDMIN